MPLITANSHDTFIALQYFVNAVNDEWRAVLDFEMDTYGLNENNAKNARKYFHSLE